MPDIFISYSRKDSEQALQLAELLSSAGLTCWIDTKGIDVATSWSAEIVDAIDECKAFVILLSSSSAGSHNVAKELALASERRKKILPLDLEPIELPREFAYQLAGIQRSSMTNIDSIIRALGKLGLEATGAPQAPTITRQTDGRKSLMILPFEDLSPTQDNQWFADGLASELVGALSNVKALRLIDWNTSKMLRNKSISTVELAKEFAVRYFIEGQVRKFGDQIKISVTLLDIETGDHLWQDSLKGTMADIFDVQETVAKKVVDGLKLHLGKEEKAKLLERGTENPEAYECYIKGEEYYNRYTLSDFERALSLWEEAERLDPGYASAWAGSASALTTIHRIYTRDPSLLERAEQAAERVREIGGITASYCAIVSGIHRERGDANAALDFAKRSVEIDPNYLPGYQALAIAFNGLGDLAGVARARREVVRIREDYPTGHFNLLIALNELMLASHDLAERVLHETALREAGEKAIPVYQRYTRLNPDIYDARVNFANVYLYAGRPDTALRIADELSLIDTLDGNASYNLACLYLKAGNADHGLQMLGRSVERGYRNLETLRRDPDIDPIRGTPEFAEILKVASQPNDAIM
jgi:adenylate cyclase